MAILKSKNISVPVTSKKPTKISKNVYPFKAAHINEESLQPIAIDQLLILVARILHHLRIRLKSKVTKSPKAKK